MCIKGNTPGAGIIDYVKIDPFQRQRPVVLSLSVESLGNATITSQSLPPATIAKVKDLMADLPRLVSMGE